MCAHNGPVTATGRGSRSRTASGSKHDSPGIVFTLENLLQIQTGRTGINAQHIWTDSASESRPALVFIHISSINNSFTHSRLSQGLVPP
uniref:Uncharacterized protein n=1 Tax=Neogobius melanostomus TaxID=47308 RepID=A0A8C6UKZ0_9GOBI